jgi:hypothetical protein
MEKIELVMSLLREHDSTPWVADQVASSFGQGVSMNAKDALGDAQFEGLEPSDLTAREKQKREKYETTRPYTDGEKLELLADALETLYVDLPAIQVAGLELLQGLGVTGTSIEFAPPDEPEQGRHEYTVDLQEMRKQKELLIGNFERFKRELEN